ncbi:MAG: HAD family phosphatase [Pseudomonadota bacterium]
MTPTVVVFDIGGVLVDWQPHLAWSDTLGIDGAKSFMARVDFLEKNKRADHGERFEDLAAEIDDVEDRRRLGAYVSLYARTVPHAVPGTWEIVDRLIAHGVPLHGITNWSAETWPEGLKVHPRLDEIFGTLVVSGRERISKPEKGIFDLLCARAGVTPSDCVFIDDGPHNVDGARAAGMDAIHFTGAATLEQELSDRGLL